MNINPTNSALVLIEFQNQWTQPGLYHSLLKRQILKRDSIRNASKAVKAARAHGLKVIHAPLVIDPKAKRGIFAHLTQGLVFNKNSARSQIDHRVYDSQYDVVATGRIAFDAFIGSNLEQILKDSKIQTVFFCGFATDQCVAKTMRTAVKLGVDSYLLTDASATFFGFLHRSAETAFEENTVTTKTFISRLSTLKSASETAEIRS